MNIFIHQYFKYSNSKFDLALIDFNSQHLNWAAYYWSWY